MFKALFLFVQLLFLPVQVFAQAQQVEFKSGQIVQFALSIDRRLLERINIPPAWHDSIDNSCQAAVYLPQGSNGIPADRVLVVYGPGGGNISAMHGYTGFADKFKAALITVEHRRHDHDDRAQYYYTRRLIEHLKKLRVLNPDAPVVLTGFSGGSKMALCVGVYGGNYFRGVLSIGINVDLASMAYKWLPNGSALGLRIILLNAEDDALVKDYTQGLLRSMRQTGFRNVRNVSYQGGHIIPFDKVITCLSSLYQSA